MKDEEKIQASNDLGATMIAVAWDIVRSGNHDMKDWSSVARMVGEIIKIMRDSGARF